MPTLRPDLREIPPYRPGRPIADVAEEYGFDPTEVVKLASNEWPEGPFPEVVEAMRGVLDRANRYPDNEARELRAALASHLSVPADHVWVGAGSSELIRVIATAAGGPGTSAVFARPSFVLYRLASTLAMSARIEVPLTPSHVHDLAALAAAVRDDTTVLYVCNPNNPTGTAVGPAELARFVEAVPERVLVVVDEAYHEFTGENSAALPLAVERPNVIVTRTFSKVYGLASLRVGYAVSLPETLAGLRKGQAPFTVTTLGQVAAREALAHPAEVARRVAVNAAGRAAIESALARLGVEHIPSRANFVSFRTGASTQATVDAFLHHGVILRPFDDGWVRVTVGGTEEVERFLAVLEAVRPGLG
jgi:histidinol-phosphate aminotransferase